MHYANSLFKHLFHTFAFIAVCITMELEKILHAFSSFRRSTAERNTTSPHPAYGAVNP